MGDGNAVTITHTHDPQSSMDELVHNLVNVLFDKALAKLGRVQPAGAPLPSDARSRFRSAFVRYFCSDPRKDLRHAARGIISRATETENEASTSFDDPLSKEFAKMY